MKKIKIIFIFSSLFLLLFLFAGKGFAQQTSPPDPPGHGETTDQQAGGGAPIGSGLFILLGLGTAYAGKKLYSQKKNLLNKQNFYR